MLLRKYGVQSDIYFPLIKAGANDFATSSDYTHSSGDIKVSKDGGTAATATNSPSAITMGNGAMWKLTLTATELTAALVKVTLVDAATKAVEDQMILIETYGHANAQHAFDLDTSIADLYHADIQFTRDQANTQDEWSVTWFKNGVRQTSGITSPTIQLVKRVDGTDLLAATAMTQIGSTGSYKYDATGSNRITVGEAVIAVVVATIDSSSRTFSRLIGRDSS